MNPNAPSFRSIRILRRKCIFQPLDSINLNKIKTSIHQLNFSDVWHTDGQNFYFYQPSSKKTLSFLKRTIHRKRQSILFTFERPYPAFNYVLYSLHVNLIAKISRIAKTISSNTDTIYILFIYSTTKHLVLLL